MNEILREYVDINCVGFLGDVIIYPKNPAQHVEHVRNILAVLRKHKLYAKVEKCEFNQPRMTFVGYMMSTDGIGMDPTKISAITEWPVPRSIKEVQSFLGFANFCRKFIHGYSALASPLTSLTRKAVKSTWSPGANAAFI